MPRSAEFEHDFLDEASRGAGLVSVGLTEKAEARLERGEQEYEDTSLALPLSQLVDEIEDEVTDVACWAVLMAQADDIEELGDEKRYSVLLLLQSLTGLAAQQALHVREVRQALER